MVPALAAGFFLYSIFIMNTENLQLSPLRSAIFPIANWELKKFVPFALMIFITVFNFTMLRNYKDTLVLTAPESGAEVLSYLKSLVVLPLVIMCSALYVRLRKNVSFERSYNIIIGTLIILLDK